MDTSYFLEYESQLPDKVGFVLFGKVHLSWLIGIVVCLCIFLHFFRKSEKKIQRKILHILGWILVLLEIGRTVFLWKIQFLSVYELPLHLCGLAGILCLLHAYTKWEWLAQTIYAACLPGTIGALLFPDWTMYPMLNVIHIQAFLFHGLVVFYGFAMLKHGFRPNIRKLYQPILFLVVTAILIYAFDLRFKANYMFLQVPSKDSPLMLVAKITGEKWYLIGLITLSLMVMLMMYGVYGLFDKVNNRKLKDK